MRDTRPVYYVYTGEECLIIYSVRGQGIRLSWQTFLTS